MSSRPRSRVHLPALCDPVQGYAVDNSAQVPDPLYYGYANRVYTADDLCPME